MSTVRRILVATSLGKTSDPVVRAGHIMARYIDAELHLAHAYSIAATFYGSPMGMATVHPYPVESERDQVEGLLNNQLERLGLSQEDVNETTLAAGTPHRLLINTAQEANADLIVVGASDEQSALMMGSTADRILRLAHKPVLVVRGELALPPKRILIPLDLSDLCEESIRAGLAFLDSLCGESCPELQTLFVLSNVERTGSSQFSPDQVERFAQEELERRTQELCEGTRWTATSCLRIGRPQHEILAELEERPADIVLAGTHGRSGFERLLLGSVACDLVRRSSTHVLVVPPDAARAAAEEEIHRALENERLAATG